MPEDIRKKPSAWDGVTGKGVARATMQPAIEADLLPEIRGTVRSPLTSDEVAYVRLMPSPTKPDRRMWPLYADPGADEPAQAHKDGGHK